MSSSSSPRAAMSVLQRASVLALAVAHMVSAARVDLMQRDGAPSTPATIPIQLSYDGYGRYLIPVGMSSGPGEQDFNFTLSTSTGLTSVAGTSCTTCGATTLYNQTKSTTAQSLNGVAGADLVGTAVEGTVVKEVCTMQTANGSDWKYTNQTIVVANSQSAGSIFNNNLSGVLGLGTNRNAAASNPSGANFTAGFNDTIYGQWMNRNPAQDTFQYGMSLSPPITTPKNTTLSEQPTVTPKSDAGRLDWLQPDDSAYNKNSMAAVSVQSNSSANYSTSGGQPDFTVELDGWTFKSGGSEASNNDILVTTVDPYYTDIYFPLSQAQLLNELIAGSSYEPTLSSLGNQSGAWLVPCDSTYTFSVTIGGQTFTLDQSTLMTNNDGVCTSGIEGWVDSKISQYILGARFLSQFYVIFQINRNGTDTVILASRSSTSHSGDVGAIVGGTVGGVAGLLLIALGAFFFWRRWQNRTLYDEGEKPALDDHIAAAHVEPYIVAAAPPLSATQSVFSAQQTAFSSPPGSPGAGDPLLQHDMHMQMDVPPAYEATVSSPTDGPPSPRRTAKGEYVLPSHVAAMQGFDGEPSGSRQPVSPMASSFGGASN